MSENIGKLNTNRLIHQKSPYLLQHAYNPVDWYAWGDEAFARARQEDKPIFLSIGYSTCHWCHVMERQSFENEHIAHLLNADFVAIKVDREERPDIDHIYMQVCQALTGSGGWPLTIIMTPDRQPFYAATYIPPYSQGGMTGLMELLPRLTQLWKTDHDKALQAAREISQWTQKASRARPGGELSEEILHDAYENLARTFDRSYGGFGSAPKFPTPTTLIFLLKYHERYQNPTALEMAEQTLTCMYQGGIYDHIGFGFARYSTDRRWLVPHFEKMLYDNALLAIAYLEAYRITNREIYKRVAQDIFTYVLRDMTAPEGGFYSAEDADSEGEEGKYYVWDKQEICDLLEDKAAPFCEIYDITEAGNFEGRSIPNLIGRDGFSDARDKYTEERRLLFTAREKRIKPLKDDKVLTSWNGLMIAALGVGSRILNNTQYLQAAQKAAAFILSNLRRQDGRLLARYRDGEALYNGYAVDYAFLIWGLLEIYAASGDRLYLEQAQDLNDDFIRWFWDGDEGGFFFYGSDSEELLIRPKESYDSVMPSDNAVEFFNLLRLNRLTGEASLGEKAQLQVQHFAGTIAENPGAHTFWLQAFLYQRQGMRIVLPR